jgi:hypothetical protein
MRNADVTLQRDFLWHLLPKNTLQGYWRNQRRHICLEPNSKFIVGAEDSDGLRLRLGLCVGKRRGSIHFLRWLT